MSASHTSGRKVSSLAMLFTLISWAIKLCVSATGFDTEIQELYLHLCSCCADIGYCVGWTLPDSSGISFGRIRVHSDAGEKAGSKQVFSITSSRVIVRFVFIPLLLCVKETQVINVLKSKLFLTNGIQPANCFSHTNTKKFSLSSGSHTSKPILGNDAVDCSSLLCPNPRSIARVTALINDGSKLHTTESVRESIAVVPPYNKECKANWSSNLIEDYCQQLRSGNASQAVCTSLCMCFATILAIC